MKTETVPTHKECTRCLKVLPLDAFGKHPGCRFGVRPECKECRKQYRDLPKRPENCIDCGADIRHRHAALRCEPCAEKEQDRQHQEYYERNLDTVKQRSRARVLAMSKEERLAKSREQMLKGHGINQEIYDTMLEEQGGVCKTCKCPETHMYQGVVIQLAVDHDHACCPGRWSCGKCVRGLLCHNCNNGLGDFKDDIQVLLAAIEYLKAWELKRGARLND